MKSTTTFLIVHDYNKPPAGGNDLKKSKSNNDVLFNKEMSPAITKEHLNEVE